MNIDRLPPNSVEAEQGVLGSILWAPAESLAECCKRLREDGNWFYDLRHETIYAACVALQADMKPVEIFSVQQRLKDGGTLDECGGIAYLSSLQDAVPSAANLSYYLEILEEKAMLRRAIRLCTDFVGRAYENEGEAATLIDEIERDVLKIRQQTTERRTRKEMVQGAIGRIEQRFNSGGKPSGIDTGLFTLDKLTDGLHPGELIVVAAFPSVGKSALVGNIAAHVAIELKLPVAVFSLEMTGEEWMERMIAAHSRVNVRGDLTERSFAKMTFASGLINAAPLFIEDESDVSIGQLRASARRMSQQHGIRLFIVDYLQLVSAPDIRAKDNREQEVAAIANGLKNMAKELNAPVIVLSQLNDDGKLRESRATGQHADGVWKLRREEGGNAEAEPVALDIEKQRNGSRGTVHFTFLKTFTKFEVASPVDDKDVPYEPHKK